MQFQHRRQHRHHFSDGVTDFRLSEATPGQDVLIKAIDEIGPSLLRNLHAYGIFPGRTIQVLSQRPVTIIQVDESEIAFESEIANKIICDRG